MAILDGVFADAAAPDRFAAPQRTAPRAAVRRGGLLNRIMAGSGQDRGILTIKLIRERMFRRLDRSVVVVELEFHLLRAPLYIR